MAACIEVFNNDQRVGETSHAFNCHTVHELMRMYTLQFSIANTNAIRKYIVPGAVFICDGQAYDLVGFKKESGSNNVATVSAEHVLCHLLKYKLPAGYSFVGTLAQIAADMLNVAIDKDGNKASTEFQIGTTPDLGTVSFSLNNTDVVTAKYAIMALKNVGAESDFDNFTINFSKEFGGGQTQAFEFGVNMADVSITYDKSNGTTYEIDIADLQIKDPEDHPFDIGWYAHVKDFTTGEEFTKRIITYDRCLDDPTQDKITLGVFISDVSTETAKMSIDIDNTASAASHAQDTANDAKSTADNSVQQGQSYNNVDISHQYGFRSVSGDGLMRTLNNGTQGFLIQHLYNGSWVTVWEADSASGKTIAYNLDHTQKVEMGGETGYQTFRWANNLEMWLPSGGQGADGSTGASKIFNPDTPQEYGIIGGTPEGNSGLALYHNDKVFCRLLATGGGGDDATGFAIELSNGNMEIGANTDGDTYMKRDNGGTETQVVCRDGEIDFGIGNYWRGSVADDGVHANSVSGDLPVGGASGWSDFTLHVKNGIITGWDSR